MNTKDILSTDNFKKYLQTTSLSPYTIDGYCRAVNEFFRFYTENQLSLKKEHVFEYIASLNGKNLSPSKINLGTSAIKKYYQYLIDYNLITKNVYIDIFDGIQTPKIIFKKQISYTKNEVENIIEFFRSRIKDFNTLRNFVFILICATTGARRKEIGTLKIQDIDLITKHIELYNTKNNNPRSIKISDELTSYLKKYIEQHHAITKDIDNLFITKCGKIMTVNSLCTLLVAIVKKERKQPKPKLNINLEFHAFRRSFATELHKNGTSLYKLSKILGHSNINMTSKYIHDTDTDNDVLAYSYNDCSNTAPINSDDSANRGVTNHDTTKDCINHAPLELENQNKLIAELLEQNKMLMQMLASK